MSKLLQKILSDSIFPAALMIVGKLGGIVLVNSLYALDWSLQTNTSGFFSVQIVYDSTESVILSNSYSNLCMLFVMLLGTGIQIFKGYFLHSTHQNPKVLVKLVQFDFMLWLVESSTLFPKMAVWLAFLWISTIITVVQAIQSISYSWIAIGAFISTVIATWLIIRDFEREIQTLLPENGKLVVK